MKVEEANEKVEMIKNSLAELYEAGIIKADKYNEIWAKLNEIKTHVKCEE